MLIHTAAYDPADDKLRLQPACRLDKEEYATVKAAGFGWAPKQGCFYAVWSPSREDLLIKMCGEIGDEDTTLVDRAEQRAERFEEYSEKREADAYRARSAVERITDGIPMGQPILIGHHSERHARKDAERIENGMRKAVKMWETSKYWESRAAGALAHAKYKEVPAVRARRIKGLESDLRKQRKYIEDAEMWLKAWVSCGQIEDEQKQMALALRIAGSCNLTMPQKEGDKPDWSQRASAYDRLTNHYPTLYAAGTVAECVEAAQSAYPQSIAHHERWVLHIENRLVYERAMLADGGGLAADKFNFAVGGRVQRRGEWFVVTAVNRKAGAVCSVSVVGHWCATIQVEDITDYKEPPEGAAEKVKAAMKAPPLVNFRAAGCVEMTMADWKARSRGSDSWTARNFSIDGDHTFGRIGDGEKPIAYRQRARCSWGAGFKITPVFITDAAVKEPPKEVTARPSIRPLLEDLPTRERRQSTYKAPEPTEFEAMKDALRSGAAVQVVSAPQLFPTPAALAARMVEMSGVQAGDTVLEPSAGTGAIVRAVIEAVDTEIVGYEINRDLVSHLTRTFPSYKLQARCDDFLNVTEGQGQFPIVLMNPPFANGADIKHIQHARKFLRPGGTLVAICANGPRQREALMSEAEHWEDLPAGTFSKQGTNVNTAMLVMRFQS